MMYCGWDLTPQAREEIMLRFPPIYPEVRCNHVTYDVARTIVGGGVESANIRAYGILDFEGFQILAVTVDGKLFQPRRDRMFHVTLSRVEGQPSSRAGLILANMAHKVRPIQTFMVPAIPFIRNLGER